MGWREISGEGGEGRGGEPPRYRNNNVFASSDAESNVRKIEAGSRVHFYRPIHLGRGSGEGEGRKEGSLGTQLARILKAIAQSRVITDRPIRAECMYSRGHTCPRTRNPQLREENNSPLSPPLLPAHGRRSSPAPAFFFLFSFDRFDARA